MPTNHPPVDIAPRRAAVPPLTIGLPVIWLVDDSRTQVAFTEQALGPSYQFERFEDGPSVLQRLGEAAKLPDLLLLDWVMPGLSGDEVCRFLRANPATRELPIVILTASRTETEDIVCALDSGANDYVARPFVPEELRARVGAILRAQQVKQAADRERLRVTTISQLGRALFLAGSDIEAILRELAGALVGSLCDGCAVTLLAGSGAGSATARHRTDRGTALLGSLAGITDPVVHAFTSPAQALAALPASYADYVRDCGLRGLAVMAIPVRELAHGVITLTRDHPAEPFDPRDLAAIGTCLEHTGLALEAAIRSEAERATTRFHEEMLGIVGHDLRNPLAAMVAGIELLRARVSDPASARVLGRLDNSARRMTTIVDQLLDVTRARLDAGIPIERRALRLQPMIANLLDELRLAYPTAAFELRGDDVEGKWDGGRLGQVVSNLASNAAQYGAAGGPVVVELARAGGDAIVAISNPIRGAPIPPDTLETLFDPFQRGRSGEHPGGLGLGLYIVREIVRAHGGTIEAVSSDAGTTFRVALPIDPDGPGL
ncbi:MAG TPA: ATP-binding protein [Kofleriaceae bacterium]|nr:ATP-binding protein [Kofleriaceae bacterium]